MKVTGKAAQASVFQKVRAMPFTRIPGKLTRRDYITLQTEVCKAACAIESDYKWSGEFGHLPLVTGAAEYLRITTDSVILLTYEQETQPEAFNPQINVGTSDHQVHKKTVNHEEKQECWYRINQTKKRMRKRQRMAQNNPQKAG